MKGKASLETRDPSGCSNDCDTPQPVIRGICCGTRVGHFRAAGANENTRMGRVARYKKIKSCDPFSKERNGRVVWDNVGVWGLGESGRKAKKRSKTAEKLRAAKKRHRKQGKEDDHGFDAPPGKDDFDLADIMGSIRKEKPSITLPEGPSRQATSGGTVVANQKDAIKSHEEAEEDVKTTRLLKIDKQLETKEKSGPPLFMKPGESKRAYDRRVKSETKHLIEQQSTRYTNPEKKERKKEFLKKKKQKKKKNKFKDLPLQHAPETIEEDRLVTVEEALAARGETPRFGEQAERPPEFKHLPRGAKKSNDGLNFTRMKIQAQYAAIKSRRKQQGDFHL